MANNLEFYCDRNRHLVCVPYSVENLHETARQLGIKRCWFHAGRRPHYDIPKTRRQEISAKCNQVTARAILSITYDHHRRAASRDA